MLCLNYPLLNEYVAFDDERKGVNLMIDESNGLRALSQREDGVRELIRVYADYPVLSQVQKDVSSKDYHLPYKLPFLELVLSNDTFLNQLDNNELEELRKIVINKYARKVQNSEVYSLHNVKKTMLLATVIINKQKDVTKSIEEQKNIDSFIKNFNTVEPDVLTEISKIMVRLY